MIIVTTSTGIVKVDIEKEAYDRIADGFFYGVDRYDSDNLIIASRTDVNTQLSLLNVKTGELSEFQFFDSVRDVHQIIKHHNLIFMSNTYYNSVVVYDVNSKEVVEIPIGEVRKDVDHINSFHIQNEKLYVLLSGNGFTESRLVAVDLCDYKVLSTQKISKVVSGHNLYPYEGGLLVSSSASNKVYKITREGVFLFFDLAHKLWIRGITEYKGLLAFGLSNRANRHSRHNTDVDGMICLYSPSSKETIDIFELENTGQINDLIYVEES